jgi:hypothetical protein
VQADDFTGNAVKVDLGTSSWVFEFTNGTAIVHELVDIASDGFVKHIFRIDTTIAVDNGVLCKHAIDEPFLLTTNIFVQALYA